MTGPSHGTLTLNADGSFTYTPAANYNGADSFTYRANDGALLSNVATVTITVVGVNDAPVADNDTATTAEDTAVVIAVLANDTDVEGATLSVAQVADPPHGTVVLNADGRSRTRRRRLQRAGQLHLPGERRGAASNVATVTITVPPVNDAPVANDERGDHGEDTAVVIAPACWRTTPTWTATLSVAAVSDPPHGSAGAQRRRLAHLHAGRQLQRRRTASPTRPTTARLISNVATVTITVTPVNDAPVAADDGYATDEDTPLTVAAPGVLANDTDVDGETLTAVLVAGPTHGTLTLNADGSFTYTPAANYNGTDSFTYRANDGHGRLERRHGERSRSRR